MAENDVRKYRMVAIGGSAGCLDVILKIASSLPPDSGSSFIVITHRKNDSESILVDLLASRTIIKVKEVEDKESILPNTIYVAPSDYHLLIEDKKTFSLDSSEKIHFSRPSIDVTMEMVADVFTSSAIGILLSGANADGAAGLHQIKEKGGFTIVQDPLSAEVSFMPLQAINLNAANEILNAEAICEKLNYLLATAKS
ncbi:MAG: chemotaxis protein CheB [Bacteroidota bacterium]